MEVTNRRETRADSSSRKKINVKRLFEKNISQSQRKKLKSAAV